MRAGLVFVAALALVASASAAEIPLDNADFETGAKAPWGPSGGVADHATFARPNNGTLGAYFGYYSAGNNDPNGAMLTETVGLALTDTFEDGFDYTFTGWVYPGGNDVGSVPFQIGYDDGGTFVELATAVFDVTGQGQWLELAGVTHTVSGGVEVGMPIWVRLGDQAAGGASDIWFDSLSLNKVPEPASLLLLGVAGLLLRRR